MVLPRARHASFALAALLVLVPMAAWPAAASSTGCATSVVAGPGFSTSHHVAQSVPSAWAPCGGPNVSHTVSTSACAVADPNLLSGLRGPPAWTYQSDVACGPLVVANVLVSCTVDHAADAVLLGFDQAPFNGVVDASERSYVALNPNPPGGTAAYSITVMAPNVAGLGLLLRPIASPVGTSHSNHMECVSTPILGI